MATACTNHESKTNHNVRVALIASTSIGVADSIWNGTVLASYCYDLGNGSNTFVGLVEAANGLVQLLVAVPVGTYADGVDEKGMTRKVWVTRLACPMTFFAAACTSAITWTITFWMGGRDTELKWALILVMMMWGLTEAVVMGPFQAMFADSIPTGERSKYYSLLYATYIGASAAGPLVSISLFCVWGNTWSPRQLAKVLLSGMALEVLTSPLFLAFSERSLLGAEADAATEQREEAEEISTAQRGEQLVPWTLFSASLLSSLGSGMTVKFFPLFFRETVGLSPINVQIIYAVVPLAMVIGMAIAQHLHPIIGRVQTMCVCKLVGVVLLVAMIGIVEDAASSSHYDLLLVTVYVLRTCLANCTYPIEESILMDFVPRSRRARWKSLESISSFGWCGAALVGGLIADKYSYTATFSVTACFQFAATLLVATLIFVVPRHESELRRGGHQDGDQYQRLEDNQDATLDFNRSSSIGVPSTTSDDHARISLHAVHGDSVEGDRVRHDGSGVDTSMSFIVKSAEDNLRSPLLQQSSASAADKSSSHVNIA